jgi:hypothetical protein
VIDKNRHKLRELKTIGVNSDEKEINELYYAGKKWISSYCVKRDMFEIHAKEKEEKQFTEYLLSNVENILLNAIQLILNSVFKLTGFNTINDNVLIGVDKDFNMDNPLQAEGVAGSKNLCKSI